MKHQLEVVPCPLCDNSQKFFTVNNTLEDAHIRSYDPLYGSLKRSKWRVCGRCGLVLQNPKPSIESLNQFYSDSKYHAVKGSITPELEVEGYYINFMRYWYEKEIEYVIEKSGLQTGSVFDVGCGMGGALALFVEQGWKASGVEPDRIYCEFAQRVLKLENVRPELLKGDIREEPVDLVWSHHTFEHIADLHEVMRGIQKILKPGGYVFTAVPTFHKSRSRLSLLYMNSAHYWMFSHKSLNHLFSFYGLEEVCHTYRGARGVDEMWHVAKYTGVERRAEDFYENPREVVRYINRFIPFNALVFCFPHVIRPRGTELLKLLILRLKLLRDSPKEFWSKFWKKLSRTQDSSP